MATDEPTRAAGHQIHPLAAMYPMVGDDELALLAASITADGQREPIIAAPNNTIVDGRNRLEACRRAGAEPWIEVDGTLTTEAAISARIRAANVSRRHLTTGQRVAAEALHLGKGSRSRKTGRWKRGSIPKELIAESPGIAQRMAEAGTVLDMLGEGALRSVLAGDITLATLMEYLQVVKVYPQVFDPAEVREALAAARAVAQEPYRPTVKAKVTVTEQESADPVHVKVKVTEPDPAADTSNSGSTADPEMPGPEVSAEPDPEPEPSDDPEPEPDGAEYFWSDLVADLHLAAEGIEANARPDDTQAGLVRAAVGRITAAIDGWAAR